MGNKEPLEQAQQMQEDAKQMFGSITDMADKVQKYMKEMNPEKQRNAVIDGNPVVAQLFENMKVTIIFGSKQEAEKFFNSELKRKKKFWIW